MSHHKQGFLQKLRERGHRLTPQRQLILDTLCDLGGHTTINELYEQVHSQAPAIDRATVYRSIQLFEEHAFVHSAKINGQTVYEIAPEEPHHHLVCQKCEAVMALANHHFDALADHLRDEHGFVASFNHLTIPGICANCHERTTNN